MAMDNLKNIDIPGIQSLSNYIEREDDTVQNPDSKIKTLYRHFCIYGSLSLSSAPIKEIEPIEAMNVSICAGSARDSFSEEELRGLEKFFKEHKEELESLF